MYNNGRVLCFEHQKLIPRLGPRLLEVLDKGKAAAVTSIVHTKDKATGKVIFESQSTVFIRGAGGFGGKQKGIGTIPACPHRREFERSAKIAVRRLLSTSHLSVNLMRPSKRRPAQHKLRFTGK